MAMTITATDLNPAKHGTTGTYSVPNLLLTSLSSLPLRGDQGAIDLLFPAAFDDDPDTVLTEEENIDLVGRLAEFSYLDRDVLREDGAFALELSRTALSTKGAASFADLSITFGGRDFRFGRDPLGPVLPIDGTIETIELSLVSSSGGRRRGEPADIEISVTGLDLDITPALFSDADTFAARMLRGDQVLSFSPYLISSFAGDGRHLVGGTTSRGGHDFIELTDEGRNPGLVGAPLQFAGDFLTVEAGAVLNGGADTLVGSFPTLTLGDTPPRIGAPVGEVSGDALDVAGEVNGGNDVLNFTDSLTAASAGLFGDAARVS
ncbi:hypothetical protein, partial [Pseudodonghicola flavimaris]